MADPETVFGKEKWEYMVRHVDDTRSPLIIAICTLGIFFSILFLGMRLWSRKLGQGKLRLDLSDWLCVVSVFFTLMTVIDILVGVRYGAGRHIPAVPDVRSLYLVFIIANAAHPVGMGGMKISLLVLFYSIFPSRKFRWCCWSMGVFIILWIVVSVVAGVALCVPIEKLWDSTVRGGYCLPLTPMGLAITSAQIFTDLVMLLMPLPLVLNLQITRKRKVLVIAAFMAGGVVCIISIVRLPVWLKAGSTGDFGWDNIPGAMLAVAELAVGVLASSAPVYRPLLQWASGKGRKACEGTDLESNNTPVMAWRSNLRSEATRGQPMMPLGEHDRSITVTAEFELSTQHKLGGRWHQIPGPPYQDTDYLFSQ